MSEQDIESSQAHTDEEKQRVRAAERQDQKMKYQNRVRYKKKSNIRRKFKKRFQKNKVAIVVSLIVLATLGFLLLAIQTAYHQTKEQERKNIERKIQNKINEVEKNKPIH